MRWFKHLSRAHLDEAMTDLIQNHGHDAYGFYWQLLEIVAESMDGTGRCSVTHPLPQWSRLLYCHHHRVSKHLGTLQVMGLISVEYAEGKVKVTIPNLLKYRDEYSKKSGHAPGESPDTPRTDVGSDSSSETHTDTHTDTPKGKTDPELEKTITRVAGEIHSRHPDPRRDIGVGAVCGKLRTIARKVPKAERIPLIEKINKIHTAWCATFDWRKEGGQYAKGLENWLAPTMGRYSVEPPTAIRPSLQSSAPMAAFIMR